MAILRCDDVLHPLRRDLPGWEDVLGEGPREHGHGMICMACARAVARAHWRAILADPAALRCWADERQVTVDEARVILEAQVAAN